MCENVTIVWLELSCKVIAAAVLSDPTTYTEAILGKPNQDYVEWISKPDKWGGNLRTSFFMNAIVLLKVKCDSLQVVIV